MRIAFFVNAFPMMSEAFIANSAAALMEQGHQVDIFGLGNVEPTGLSVPEVSGLGLAEAAVNARWPKDAAERWLNVPSALAGMMRRHGPASPLRLSPGIYRRSLADLSAIYQVASLPADGVYDILHCQFAPLAEYVIKHRRAGFLKGRIVVNFRGYDISEVIRSEGEHVYDHIWPEAEGYIANCEYFRQRAISIGCPADRIRVVGSGIRLGSFPFQPKPEVSPDGPRFLLVGRLIERKGFHIALQALAQYARNSHQRIHVDIVGDGPMRPVLERLASEYGLGESAHFHGALSHAAIAEFLKTCDVLLAPSMTCSNGSQDGPVNTVKEAMAIGRPVVATRHGGISELVVDGETGVLCPEGDVDALEEAVHRIFRLRPDWPRMLARARAYVEDTYALARTTGDLLQVYETVLNATVPDPDKIVPLSKESIRHDC